MGGEIGINTLTSDDLQGTQGTTGTQGTQGPSDGPQGTQGTAGTTGTQGVQGIQGSSNEGVGAARTEVSASTGSIGAGLTADVTITGAKLYSLLKVGISSAAWVRLYTDTTSRTNDETR